MKGQGLTEVPAAGRGARGRKRGPRPEEGPESDGGNHPSKSRT